MRGIRVWRGVLIAWRKKGHALLRAWPLYSHEWEFLVDKRRLMPGLALPNGAMAGWTVVDIAACAAVLASGLPLRRGCPRCGVAAPSEDSDESGKPLSGAAGRQAAPCHSVIKKESQIHFRERRPNFWWNRTAKGALREQRVDAQP